MNKKILLVDDEIDLTLIMKYNLESTGRFEVRTESRGRDALATARAFLPDLIFLDIMMPDMPGDDVAALIEKDSVLAGTKYVFLTAAVTHREVNARHGDIGGKPFLAKPVNIQEMIAMIDTVIAY